MLDILEEVFSRRYHSKSGSLERFQEIANQLGAAYQAYPSIHIAGTNGKGSVSHKIARALQLAGLKVGLFTSPHLESFGERILINGVQIPEELAKQKLLQLLSYQELSFFELITLLAFDYFKNEKVDIAVFEVGIGGLKDCTNLITPKVSVITSIADDHANLLGKTLDEIAFQKAGIIKPGIPVVLGPTCNFPSIQTRIQECQSRAYDIPFQRGFYDLENQAIAHQALKILQSELGLKEEHIQAGIQVRPSCRFEQKGRVIFDVAHNPAGIQKLIEAMEFHFPEKPWSVVIGMSKDKDLRTCFELLAAKARHLYVVPSPSPKGASVQEINQILEKSQIKFSPCESVTEGVKKALETSEDRVVVCGSFYIMKEARFATSGI